VLAHPKQLIRPAVLIVIFAGLLVVILSQDKLLRNAFLLGAVAFVIVMLLPRSRRTLLAGVIITGFLIVAPLFLTSYQNDTLSDYAVYAMAAISLNMLIGMSGQISLGHGALLAISAYTVGIMVQQHHVSFYSATLIGAVLASAVGLLLGLPAVRLTGPYLAIATLGLAISLPAIGKWQKVERWTGASQGIQIRPKFLPQVPGWLDHFPKSHLQPDEFKFYLTLLATIISGFIVYNVGRGRTGRALAALRDSEPAAQVMGINLARYKVLAFVISAFVAGLSGAFLAYTVGGVHPDTFGLNLSIAILAMIVVGGLDSILGSVLGAIVIRWITLNATRLPAPTDIPALGSHLGNAFKSFPIYAAGVYYGLFLIVVMVLMPFGLAGAYYRLLHFPYRERLLGRQGPALVTASAGATETPHPVRDAPKEVTPR
jgi:branched-chain amino acid transport system permease protein